MFSAPTAPSSGGGSCKSIVPPALTLWPGSRIVAPSIVTRPARISDLWRERESSATRVASRRSSRSPASSAATTTVSLRACAMSNPTADDELDPASPGAARMFARVRLMMAIAGATTLIAVAAVLGVIGYRLFRAEGSAPAVSETTAPEDITALLPKGARLIATAAAGDRIAVTIEVGGATEIRTFDVKTLKPVGRLRFATEP